MDKREKIEQAVKDVITGGGDTAATIALVTLITNSVMAELSQSKSSPRPAATGWRLRRRRRTDRVLCDGSTVTAAQ